MISISAGMRGLQILLAPDDYVRAASASIGPIAKGKERTGDSKVSATPPNLNCTYIVSLGDGSGLVCTVDHFCDGPVNAVLGVAEETVRGWPSHRSRQASGLTVPELYRQPH